jgi:amino acid transporter
MPRKTSRLHENALGAGESIIMGVAGTAPAYSIAATMATLVSAVGILAPATLLYCGLIMFGVTLAYIQLNHVITSAGASYAWVGKVFHPILGFFCGWALMVASALFMVSGTIPAASATLSLIRPELVNDTASVTFVAAGWLLAVSAVIIKGIKPTSYTQVVMTVFEAGVLVLIIVAALMRYSAAPAHSFTLALFSPLEFTPQLFATGALTALFFFWGWDVTVNLSEETRNAAHTASRSSFWAMLIVLLLFMTFAVVTLLVLNDAEIERSSSNIILALAEKLFPRPWSYMAVIAVMLSTIGTLETSILQFTRTMYSKSRDGMLAPYYANLHKSWRTPWVATFVITGFGLFFLFLSSYFPSVKEIMKASVNAIGFQAAFYYGFAGLACAWHFRKRAFQSFSEFLFLALWPAASALFLFFIALYSLSNSDLMIDLIGIGGIAVGIIPLWLNRKALLKPVA